MIVPGCNAESCSSPLEDACPGAQCLCIVEGKARQLWQVFRPSCKRDNGKNGGQSRPNGQPAQHVSGNFHLTWISEMYQRQAPVLIALDLLAPISCTVEPCGTSESAGGSVRSIRSKYVIKVQPCLNGDELRSPDGMKPSA